MQAQHTLTPRIFVHARLSTMTAPQMEADGRFGSQDRWFADSTLGYLVNPEITVRLGHAALKGWGTEDLDHQVGVSVIWSKCWW